uniref:Uncharacterized protein n=1 Tax=uncultured marine virus TaxID=186617 RepID=A0A0F7L5Z3_9VIRU|nr:hypothetical protein [uncultured marine virus]
MLIISPTIACVVVNQVLFLQPSSFLRCLQSFFLLIAPYLQPFLQLQIPFALSFLCPLLLGLFLPCS